LSALFVQRPVHARPLQGFVGAFSILWCWNKRVAAELGIAIVPRWISKMAIKSVHFVSLKNSDMNKLPLAVAWLRGTRDEMRDEIINRMQADLKRYSKQA
jgi:hypothetical protein